jgi:isopenicillin N synthase-like dioxygenase
MAARELQEDINVERGLRTQVLGTSRAAKAGAGVVPVIDMSESPETVTEAMWNAASTVGFFTLKNHGISQAAIEEAFAASADFFAQEQPAKKEQSPFAAHLNSGYEFMSQVRPSTGTADQKESLQITAREGTMDGRWPTHPANLQPAVRALLEASHGLACRVLNRLEPRACPKVPPGTLAGSHKLWSHDGQCTLRLLHYPPTAPPDESEAPDTPQLWRAGPHTDWCCITLLYQLPGNEGLECAANPRKGSAESQGWLTVDPVEGGIAVNIGDMLSRWSDGRLLSNLHRVRMPTTEECEPPKSRYSIGFFMQADKHALIEAQDSEPITAGDYLLGRIKSNFEATFKAKEQAQADAAPTKKPKLS